MDFGDVPEGEYPTSDTRIVNWGGQDERWFEITASGRTGWIVYNNIIVESKSPTVPEQTRRGVQRAHQSLKAIDIRRWRIAANVHFAPRVPG